MTQYSKKIALFAVCVTAYELSAMQRIASPSVLAAARRSAQTTARSPLVKTGLYITPGLNSSLENPVLARYRSTFSRPNSQVEPQAFNKAMKEQSRKSLEPYIIGAGATAVGGALATQAGLSLYDSYKQMGREIDFNAASFAGKKIIDVNFPPHNDFSGKVFDSTILYRLNFANKCESCSFEKAILGAVSFYGANLKNSNFKKAKMLSPDFNDALIEKGDFSDSYILKGASFYRAQMPGSNFSGLTFNINQDISDQVYFPNIYDPAANSLKSSKLIAEWRGISFIRAELSSATFNNVKIVNIDKKKIYEEKNFPKQQYFREYNFNFSHAKAPNATFNNSNFSHSNFQHAELKDAKFIGSKLNDSNFNGADLSGADLTGADISGATFAGANLKGTKLNISKLSYIDWVSYKYQNGIMG